MSTSKDCLTCTQSKKKGKSSVICTGCQRPFCKEHHQEHRISIENDFDSLMKQYNLLRENLYNENNDSNSRISKLLKMIDDWEKETIAKITEIATANKIRLDQIMNEEKDQLKNRFKLMEDELKTNQTNSDYVEPDIQEWQQQINECKQKLEQLQANNNDFINIYIKSIDWNNTVNIYRRTDVQIKTKTPLPTKVSTVRRERSTRCSSCGESFQTGSGYDHEFCSQSCASHAGGSYYQAEDHMCFHGNCLVSLVNGLTKLVKDIRRGDILTAPDGSKATVTYAVKLLRKNKNASLVRFDDGLMITPWHPIRINGQWTFPHDIASEIVVECEEVYNFAVDVGHIVIINGIECVTLGHHLKGDVIEHPYYGSDKVLDDLRALDLFNDGFIELLPNSALRNKKTGLISGICRHAATINPAQFSHLALIPSNENI